MNKRVKKIANDLLPGDIFHPGEHLKDEIEARGMSQQELSNELGVSKTEISLVINGHRNISPQLAIKLEEVLGIDAEFWMTIQIRYDIDLLKKKYQSNLKKSKISDGKKTKIKKLISAV